MVKLSKRVKAAAARIGYCRLRETVMRIDRLELRNFKKFAAFELNLHPQFTLLIGDNGAGKTSVLDALAVALGVWLVEPPDSTLINTRAGIHASEIRLESRHHGDRELFSEAGGGVSIRATGQIEERSHLTWEYRIEPGKRRGTNHRLGDALAVIKAAYERASAAESVLLPVIAYYGAGRAWLPHRERSKARSASNGPARRWAAFYECLNERIRIADLNTWFQREAIAAVNRGGQFRPGFEVIRRAVIRCVPGADRMWFDGDRGEIALSIEGMAQPFNNLSAGQRMMLALVADIAIKAVTQNNHLVPEDVLPPTNGALPEVLARTQGVVLIDELDVHLHPRWQRRVASDLKSTFPRIQFVCTSHSPQVIGEVAPEEIRMLDDAADGRAPDQSYGLDSNAILEDVMGAEARNPSGERAIEAVEEALEEGDLATARQELERLKQLQHGDTRDTARLEATINNLEVLTNAGD
jgi:predicted ATP-binding protein involved in virulence